MFETSRRLVKIDWAIIWGLFSLLCSLPATTLATPTDSCRSDDQLTVAMNGSIPTLNPALTASPIVTVPASQIHASLFRLGPDFEPLPYLARNWSLSPDRKTLTVELDPKARFHDGQPVTARDVAFSIMAVKANHSFDSMLLAVERVETPESKRVVIHLDHPHPALYRALAVPLTPILPAHVYDDGNPLAWPRPPVGAGPFRFKHRVPGELLTLARFEEFALPRPACLAGITFVIFEEIRQARLAMEAGEVQLWPFLGDHNGRKLVQDNDRLEAVYDGFQGLEHLMSGFAFNLRRPPFDDPRVRQAFAHAFDIPRIYTLQRAGSFIPADGPFPPNHPFHDPKLHWPEQDLTLANQLLDAAGWTRGEDGMRFSVEVIYGIKDPIVDSTLRYLRRELLTGLGIDMRIVQTKNYPEWTALIGAGDFDLALDLRLFWGDPLMGTHRIYHSRSIPENGGGLYANIAGYAEPAVDALLDAAGREPDQQKRAELYHQFEARVARDLPYLWMADQKFHTIKERRLITPTGVPWLYAQPYDRFYFSKE